MASFIEKLASSIGRNDSLLCVGLDPDLAQMPKDDEGLPEAERLRAFCTDIIDCTADLVCCYKPNIAFFEQAGADGWAALKAVIGAVPDGIPVLLDAKRGDIGSTAKAYARAAFEALGADAITVSPYLGRDSVEPFLSYKGKAVFLLCHTSNPSASEVQNHGTPPLYQHIAREAQAWGDAGKLGFVVGATQEAALRAVRRLAPDRWILAPGIGAQGGDLSAALSAGLDAGGSGVIVPVSRGVLMAQDPRAAAQALRSGINLHRRGGTTQSGLAVALFEAGCVRFGEFTLASGQISPIYVDLRRAISYPDLFEQVVAAYAEVVSSLTFDRLAAVPYAALPAAAALAMQLRRPLVYPRKEVKGHGTGQAVEGAFDPGQTAVAIEDVVTSGGSLLQAIASLEAAGLKVRDVVVLVDREQGGRERLAETGHRLHAVLTLAGILETLQAVGKIDADTYRHVKAYLAAG
ncbi:MAG: orotidine-5'-phosphate decarboxylase [Anaerolineae bacterium]|nr:orotidine-5'-phosphate decarboxylase [Anaerolineae bacterium]